MPLWLLVALGNPGASYTFTRHNIGWLTADLIAARHHAGWTLQKHWQCLVANANPLLLLKPLTFMNLSGEAVQPVVAFYKIPLERVLVVLDDVSLPFGVLRLRTSGSDGGHNGLKSILGRFGSTACPRLRLGIGGSNPEDRAVPSQNLADFVLSPFNTDERTRLPAFLEKAADCVECILKSGIDTAMNRFNQRSSSPAVAAAGQMAGNKITQPGAAPCGTPHSGVTAPRDPV